MYQNSKEALNVHICCDDDDIFIAHTLLFEQYMTRCDVCVSVMDV